MNRTVRLSEIRGIMVISRQEGAHLGFVERIYIDPTTCSMSRLTFRHSRLTPEQAVPASALVAFGRDVVFIESEAMATPATACVTDTDRSVRDLVGVWVTTQTGSRLGTLMDVGVSVGDWQIADLCLPGRRVIAVKADDVTIGRDEVLVPASSANHIESNGGERGMALFGRLLRVDGLSQALQMLTRMPAARAVKRVTSGWPLSENASPKEAPRGRRTKSAGRISTEQPSA